MNTLRLILVVLIFLSDSNVSFDPLVNSKMSLVAKTPNAEVEIIVPKTYYQLGDTLRIEIVVRSIGGNGLLVVDKEYYSPEVRVNTKNPYRKALDISVAIPYVDSLLRVPKLVELKPLESISYSFNIVLDFASPNGPYGGGNYALDFGIRYWLYTEELSFLTIDDGQPLKKINEQERVKMVNNSRLIRPGFIDIMIFKDLSKVFTDH